MVWFVNPDGSGNEGAFVPIGDVVPGDTPGLWFYTGDVIAGK
jgi:hypothetical protein